jgi:multiple sugar transport system substrate-binding protein
LTPVDLTIVLGYWSRTVSLRDRPITDLVIMNLIERGTMRLRKILTVAIATGALFTGMTVLPAQAATEVKMILWPGPEGEAMQKVVDAYNAGQGKKDGVVVKQVLLSRDNTFAKEAALMKAKSSEYDVYFTASYLVGQHAPYLSELKGINDKVYLKASIDGLKVNKKQMALPLDTSLHFMYYRTDLVSSLSSAANTAKYKQISKTVLGKELMPNTDPETWNWDDALATAAFFTQKYNPESPTKYGYALPAKNLLYNTMIWNDVLWGLGGNWFTKGKPSINTAAGKAAIDVYRTIYTKELTSPDSSQWEYAETNAALTSGNAMMGLQWNAAYSELSSTGSTKDKVGIAVPPGKGQRTHVHALAVGVNKYSKNQAAAQKWMKHLSTVKAMENYAAAGGVPSMPKILNTMVSTNASFANIITYAGKYGYAEAGGPREFDIYAKLAEVLSPAWVGQKTAEEVAGAADAALKSLRK